MPSHIRQDSGFETLDHHKRYYIDGADLHIVAEGILFRVHGYFFSRESAAFNKKLHPASPGDVREGTTEKDPVVLKGVKPEEFEKLLWVFYNPKYSIYDASIDDWRVILKLADSFDFKEVKELAVRELHKKKDLDLISKMALYQDYKVDPRHLVPLYAELCKRDTALTLAESRILGLEATVLISTAREKLRALPSNEGRSPLPENVETGDVFRAIETELGITQGSTEEWRAAHGIQSSPTSATFPNGGAKHQEVKLSNGAGSNLKAGKTGAPSRGTGK